MSNTTLTPQNLTAEQLDELEKALIVKRQQVLDLYRHDIQVGQESTDDNADDFADRANNSYNRETMFALSDGERRTMIEIDEALARFTQSTYGVCENCSRDIALERLRAVPWARFCIDCAELDERGLLD